MSKFIREKRGLVNRWWWHKYADVPALACGWLAGISGIGSSGVKTDIGKYKHDYIAEEAMGLAPEDVELHLRGQIDELRAQIADLEEERAGIRELTVGTFAYNERDMPEIDGLFDGEECELVVRRWKCRQTWEVGLPTFTSPSDPIVAEDGFTSMDEAISWGLAFLARAARALAKGE